MPLPSVGVRRSFGGAVAAALVAMSALLPSSAPSAGAAGLPVSSTASAGSSSMTLVSQSPWVTPSGSFTVRVLLPAGSPGGAGVRMKLSLYDHLTARSTFEATLSGNPSGGLLDVAGPAAPTSATGRVVTLTVPIITSPSAVSPSLDLHCQTGSCSGVYPVAVSVSAAGGGRVLGRLLTYLSYDELDLTTPGQPLAPQALRVAWVVPLDSPDHITSASGPGSSVPPPSRRSAAAVSNLVSQLEGSGVATTVVASGRTVQGLPGGGTAGRAALAALSSLSAGTVDQFATPTYVPINAGSLAGRGLTGEVQLEMARGAGVSNQLHVRTHGGVYVVRGSTGQALGKAIAPLAVGSAVAPSALHLVVPDADLAPSNDSLTYSQPFSLDVGGVTATAAASDGHLAAHFVADPGDPVLAANQLLADLAFIHFEEPSVDYARGVVMVPPQGWSPQSEFDATVLRGLAHNPVLAAVTLDQFFATVPSHTPLTSGARRLATGGAGPTVSVAFAHAVAVERLRISGFNSAAGSAGGVTGTLADDLLASESSTLRPSVQSAGVHATDRVLEGQLDRITLATVSITLTARNEAIPVTVVSSAPYTVRATLTLSSDKFEFPSGASRGMTLDRATNPVRINAVARTSGDLPVEVTLTSRRFNLVIAQHLLTVRSTASSLVGILLTLLALAVLVAWWARTWWRGRRRRRARPAR